MGINFRDISTLLLPPPWQWQWVSQPEALQCENFQQNKGTIARIECFGKYMSKRLYWAHSELPNWAWTHDLASVRTCPCPCSCLCPYPCPCPVLGGTCCQAGWAWLKDLHSAGNGLLYDRITEYPKLEETHSRVIECLEVMRDPGNIPHLILVIPFLGFYPLSSVRLSAYAAKLSPVLTHVSLETGATLSQPYIKKLGTLNDSMHLGLGTVSPVTA